MEITFMVSIVILFIIAYFLLRYISGDFSIKEKELVSDQTWEVTFKRFYDGAEFPRGRVRRVTYKYTYESGRVKFKTFEFQV